MYVCVGHSSRQASLQPASQSRSLQVPTCGQQTCTTDDACKALKSAVALHYCSCRQDSQMQLSAQTTRRARTPQQDAATCSAQLSAAVQGALAMPGCQHAVLAWQKFAGTTIYGNKTPPRPPAPYTSPSRLLQCCRCQQASSCSSTTRCGTLLVFNLLLTPCRPTAHLTQLQRNHCCASCCAIDGRLCMGSEELPTAPLAACRLKPLPLLLVSSTCLGPLRPAALPQPPPATAAAAVRPAGITVSSVQCASAGSMPAGTAADGSVPRCHIPMMESCG